MVGETGMKVVVCQAGLRALVADPADPAGGRGWLLAGDDVMIVSASPMSSGRPGLCDLHVGIDGPAEGRGERPSRGREPAVVDAGPVRVGASRRRVAEDAVQLRRVGVGVVLAAASRCASGGGRARRHRDPAYLVQTIVRHRVDTIHFVPSMLRLFLDHPAAASCTSLRRVICSGRRSRGTCRIASSRCCPMPSCTTCTARPRPRSM